jgi:hypothetical protein
VYLGIGQGWCVGTAGRAAAIGRPAPEGWVWEPADEAAAAIAEAVAILEGERQAAFVQLPIRVEDTARGER